MGRFGGKLANRRVILCVKPSIIILKYCLTTLRRQGAWQQRPVNAHSRIINLFSDASLPLPDVFELDSINELLCSIG